MWVEMPTDQGWDYAKYTEDKTAHFLTHFWVYKTLTKLLKLTLKGTGGIMCHNMSPLKQKSHDPCLHGTMYQNETYPPSP